MTVRTLSAQQLRLLVEDKWQKDSGAVAVGLHVAQPWNVPSVVELESSRAEVVRADTVFQIREALLDAERNQGRIILLTRLQQGDLGDDVVARLARSRLFSVDHWASLCSLFKARELNRSIGEAPLAEALLEHAPAEGFPPVPTGVLDAGTIWRAAYRHVFEMGDREPDLVALLLWATSRVASERYFSASDELRQSLRQRLVTNLGSAADSILNFMDCQAGPDALALAVVCQVVFGDGDSAVLDAAAARMERYHANKPIPRTVGLALARIANDAIADLDQADDPGATQHLQRADELLKQFHCEDHAYRSRLTLRGYEERLDRFGNQARECLKTLDRESIRQCEALQKEIESHRRAGRRADQVARTAMAVRLLRWLAAPQPQLTSFAEMADTYRKELAFVDWARESICRGEDVADLTRAYQDLDQIVLGRREQFNHVFAEALAHWTSVGSTFKDIYGVEEVLLQFIARMAEGGNRILLIVLDGMSWAVCHELLADIRQDHWFDATIDASMAVPPPVIATVPSITSYSRASLLSGKLTKGDASTEKQNFEASDSLLRVCDRRNPPILFHKKEVTEGARGVIGDDLRSAILEPANKIVGLVLNAIDDRLSNAQQVREDWTINRISPLGAVLKLARDSGRVVVLASDHGHVWHRQEARLCAGDSGTRWRSNAGTLQPGEIVVTGARVREEKGSRTVVVPSVETIYYGRQQNGYHGGATPQEMVSPLAILIDKASAHPDLFQCEYSNPEWWTDRPVPSAVIEPLPASAASPRPARTLFDLLPTESPTGTDARKGSTSAPTSVIPQPRTATAGWLARLFDSASYKEQKKQIRRHPPEDSFVVRCLEVLDSNGGMMTPLAFAKAAYIPPARLDGMIAHMQRLLNVDGYEILTLSRAENRIELNVARLKRQFDLE